MMRCKVVELAKQARVTKGRKLRLDATCVQTTIHHPTDSGLLVDSVQALSRIVTLCQILEHTSEHGQVLEAMAHHRQPFAHPPNMVAGDRGVHSAETESQLSAAGVKLVAIPTVGKVPEERKAVDRGHRWENCQLEMGVRVASKRL